MVGMTQEEAEAQKISFGTGKARYADMARGKIMGAKSGFLKLVFTRDDLVIRGVHIIGYIATEMVHYGMSLVETKSTLYDVIGHVFNFPTLHDLYKYAAYDGLSNMSGHKVNLNARKAKKNNRISRVLFFLKELLNFFFIKASQANLIVLKILNKILAAAVTHDTNESSHHFFMFGLFMGSAAQIKISK